MKSGTTVARNATVLLSSSFFARLLLLGFNVVLARQLGVEQFGTYAFAVSYVTMLSVIVEFSLRQLIVRDVARDLGLAESYLSNTLVLKIFFFLFALAIVPITSKLLGYSGQIQTVLYILTLGLLFDAVINCCIALFNAAQEMRYSAVLGVVEEICFTTLGLATLGLGGGLTAIVSCRVVAQGVTQFTALFFLTRKLRIRPGPVSYAMCKKLIKHALPFFGVSVFTAIAVNMDTVLLHSMQGAAAVGLYAAAAKLVKVSSYFSRAFSDALYPVLSRQAVSQDRSLLGKTYTQSVRWITITVVPFVAFAAVQSTDIMQSLYGNDFVGASVVLHIFAWRAAIGFFTQFCGTSLYALGRQRIVFIATGAGVIVSLVLYLILIPSYSYTGAAFATLTALLVEFALQFPFVHQRTKSGSLKALVIKPLAAGIGMAIFCVFLDFVPPTALAGLGLLIYVGCLIAMGAISRDELQTLIKAPITLFQGKTVNQV
jgi:O-antigen/teichoic acid export membrane protein